MARVPGREPYRVWLHPHGVRGAPGGPAGGVRRGARFRSSSSGRAFPLSCCRESPGRGMAGLGILNRWAARTPGAPRHERAARAASSSAATAYQRRHARAVMAGATAGWVTGTAPPACPRRRATRCGQVTPGAGTTRAPRTRARRRCPGPPRPAGPRRSAGPGWPGSPTRRTGRRRSRARSAP
jgi:hypothetical protein